MTKYIEERQRIRAIKPVKILTPTSMQPKNHKLYSTNWKSEEHLERNYELHERRCVKFDRIIKQPKIRRSSNISEKLKKSNKPFFKITFSADDLDVVD